jgi:hypothetical protein
MLTIGEVMFEREHLLALSIATGFYKRAPRKIDICSLLGCICSGSIKGSPSCNDLAASLEASHPLQGPSRQAVHLRLGAPLERFIHRLLEEVIGGRLNGKHADPEASTPDTGGFGAYKRIIVQDSTIIKLPQHLFTEFSGVSNAQSKVCNARVQATYDLLSDQLITFSIDPYSKNDLTAATELHIEAGDLVLRDRGYLTMDEIQRHRDRDAHCIYRHKTGTIYLDPQTREPINLALMLRQRGHLDITALLNNKARTPVRLVAAAVNEETANLRRMKARKENHGHNPSKATLELMDYTIFITTIDSAHADFDRLLAVYGLRWRIEVIFKAWKSHMKFGVLHRVSKLQMLIILKARLLLIACCANIIYRPLERSLWQKYQVHISLLKLIRFLSASPANFLRAVCSLSATDREAHGFHCAVLRYCCYDRRNRQNYCQILKEVA